ncbi:MAG: ATP synthase F1 subunit epsilon [Candidatus Eisenbacteria bacterium]
MRTDRAFRCEIVSPEGKVFGGDSVKVVATAVDGEVGVLYNHAPLIVALGVGSLRVTLPDGAAQRFTAHGGFLEVLLNRVTVLTDRVEPAG